MIKNEKYFFQEIINLDILDGCARMRIYEIFAQVCVNIFVIANGGTTATKHYYKNKQ